MPRSRRIAVLLAAGCAACAHTALFPSSDDREERTEPAPAVAGAPAPTPASSATPAADGARLEAIRAGVEQLLAAQGDVLWQAWTSGAAPDLRRLVAGRDDLFSPDAIQLVRQARDGAAGDDRRRLSLLLAFLLGEHLANVAATTLPPATPAAVGWDGGTVPAWRVPALLAGEGSPARRAALERAWAQAERRHAGEEAARWDAIAAAAARLGYPSLLTLAGELRGESPEAMAALAEGVLRTTAGTYRAVLEELARLEMAKRLAELRGRDLPRLLGAGDDPRAFPAARAAADAQGVMAAVGLDLSARPGLLLDGSPRPGKDPRALTVPVRVPDGVRVSFAPAAGAAELRGLLHELGAAAYYAHIANPATEFRRLGTVTAETWAGLFEDVAGDPAWLAQHTGVDEHHAAPLVRAALARRLHRARTLAARVLVEIARARDPAGAPAAARAIVERAMARPVEQDEADLFLLDRDPLLESADALRAMLLAAQARAFLDARAPPDWWRSRESGAWLTAAFAEGSRRSPAQLARAFGAPEPSAAALDAVSQARARRIGLRLPGDDAPAGAASAGAPAPGQPEQPSAAAAPQR